MNIPEDASLAPAEPQPVRTPRRGFAIGGLVFVALAAVMWLAKWDVDMPDDDGGTSLWMFVVFGAIVCFAMATRVRE